MLNQAILVGRVRDIQKTKKENNKECLSLNIAVSRNYKNTNGEYEIDFLNCILWSGVAENVEQFCNIGDMVGVKGRIQNINNIPNIIAEKVTFLAGKKNEE